MLTDLNEHDRLSRQIQLSIRPLSLMFRVLPHMQQVLRSFEETRVS